MLPVIHVCSNGRGPRFVLLAGTHGNESGACSTLEHMVLNWSHVREYLHAGTYTIVPTVNPLARRANTRCAGDGVDINRAYPRAHAITRALDGVLSRADLVVDWHESWSHASINPLSLGATVYTNMHNTVLADRVVDRLAGDWSRIHELPDAPGAIDTYLAALGVHYVLVETPGQNDISPCSERARVCRVCVETLFARTTAVIALPRA